MASSVGSVDQLVAAIRIQLGGVQTRNAAKGGPARAAGAKQGRASSASGKSGDPYSSEKLAGLIGVRVRQIKRDDPDRGRKAFRVFLEAVLLSHFGPDLVNDPRFYQLVDDVQNAIEANPACQPLVGDAMAHLLNQS
jgi:hypothetical protein